MALRCFVAGTHIRRPEGDVTVETLQVGDLVQTTSGNTRPVKWIGHRDINCRRHPNPSAAYPVRIAVDAFGPDRPSQELLVSPEHSIAVDLCGEVLIAAGNLVNGSTIVQVEIDEVSYWHVELKRHDILIANNLPAESHMGNRGFFRGAGGRIDGIEAGIAETNDDFCRPVLADENSLAFLRSRLATRAEALGWAPTQDPELRLLVDGEEILPRPERDATVFSFPAAAQDVRLLSNTFVPASLGIGIDDPRKLGVCLHWLTFSGAGGKLRHVSVNDPRLREGLHEEEAKSGADWGWTKGELPLDADFWADMTGDVSLFVVHNSTHTRGWIAPARRVPSGVSKQKLLVVPQGR